MLKVIHNELKICNARVSTYVLYLLLSSWLVNTTLFTSSL